MQKINKVIPNDPRLPDTFTQQMVAPKVLVRSLPPSPPRKELDKHDHRRNPFTQLYKKLKPTINQSSDTVSIQALKALALSNVEALERTNTLQEQHKFLSDTKLHLAHIAGINTQHSERAQSITNIAQNLSVKFKDLCIHPELHDKVLRIFTRLLAPAELKNSKSSAFNHITNSRSALVSKETRSLVVQNIWQAWSHLDARKKQHVINLTLDQFENQGITPAVRESLLNLLAKEALVSQDLIGSPAKNRLGTDQTLRVLNVIDSTIHEPRSLKQLCDLEGSLVEGQRKLELAQKKPAKRNALPSTPSQHITLIAEVLDTLQELQADTTEGKRIRLPERLKFQREQRTREQTSSDWNIGADAWIPDNSPNSSDS